MSVSWWHDEVRSGRAPQPAVRMPRCTRWLVDDVCAFWTEFAAASANDGEGRQRVAELAKKASDSAREPAAVAKAKATRKSRIAARNGAAT